MERRMYQCSVRAWSPVNFSLVVHADSPDEARRNFTKALKNFHCFPDTVWGAKVMDGPEMFDVNKVAVNELTIGKTNDTLS